MYKQLIIARRDLNMSPGKLATQVSQASMAFLTTEIKKKSKVVRPLQYNTFIPELPGENRPLPYYREDLRKWAKEAFKRGEKYFYCKPARRDEKYGELQLCKNEEYIDSELTFDKDLYDEWIEGSFTKVVCGARDKRKLQKAIDKAISLGMKEGEDFFLIKDNCLTELEPEEPDGRTLTCVGFKPMLAEVIDQIGKEYNLY